MFQGELMSIAKRSRRWLDVQRLSSRFAFSRRDTRIAVEKWGAGGAEIVLWLARSLNVSPTTAGAFWFDRHAAIKGAVVVLMISPTAPSSKEILLREWREWQGLTHYMPIPAAPEGSES